MLEPPATTELHLGWISTAQYSTDGGISDGSVMRARLRKIPVISIIYAVASIPNTPASQRPTWLVHSFNPIRWQLIVILYLLVRASAQAREVVASRVTFKVGGAQCDIVEDDLSHLYPLLALDRSDPHF